MTIDSLHGYQRAYAVTPHDTNEQPGEAFFCGGAGNVAIETKYGATVVLTGCLVGHVYKVAFAKIRSTSTTATNIVALA